MMNSFVLPILLLIIGLAALWLLGLTRSGQKSFTAATAPVGSRVSRIAESVVLLCIAGAIYLFIATNTNTNGMLLNLDRLTEPLRQIHIAAAGIVLAILIASVVISYFWRGGVGIVLATVALIGYGSFLNGGLMERIVPEEAYAPKVVYTFKVSGPFSGSEDLWINDVYLGKMPLTMTWEEFSEKVPFMEEPPGGFQRDSRQPVEPWSRFTFFAMKKEERGSAFYYNTDSKDYYAKIRFNGQWAERIGGGGGGGGGRWYRKYNYSFSSSFPDRDKLIKEENNRFDALIQKARLSNYSVVLEWVDTFETFNKERFWDLRTLAKNEPGFDNVMDDIARFEYDIPKTVDEQTARRVFERICRDADASMVYATGGIEGRAIELIYDKLDVNQLVADCNRALKSGRDLRVSASWRGDEYKDYKTYSHDIGTSELRNKPLPGSFSVIRHAVWLWDKKLDVEHPDRDNLIEAEITPLYIAFRDDVEAAAGLGGCILEEYLKRQYQRHRQLEGMDLGYEDYEYVDGQSLNKWLYYLVQLDTPGGKEFRRRYSSQTEKMLKLLIDNNMNHDKEPPDFLFFDLDQGKQSLAVRFWPEYSASIENSSPPWEESKLEKRLGYLARMGNLATDEMCTDCWKKVNLEEINNTGQIIQAVRTLPRQRQLILAQHILEDLKKRKDQIRYNQDWFIREMENYLSCLGDESSIEAYLSLEPEQKRSLWDEIQRIVGGYVFKYDRGDVAADFIASGDAGLKKLAIEYLRETPTPENVALLTPLVQDADVGVKQAAQEAMKELEGIRQTPYQELVSLESTYSPPE